MSRLIGEMKLELSSDDVSIEDVRTLLQAIRDWEQKRRAVDIFITLDAPGMRNEEMKFVLDNIDPPFKHQEFIPLIGSENHD